MYQLMHEAKQNNGKHLSSSSQHSTTPGIPPIAIYSPTNESILLCTGSEIGSRHECESISCTRMLISQSKKNSRNDIGYKYKDSTLPTGMPTVQ